MQLTPQQGQQGQAIMVTSSQNFKQGRSPDYFIIKTRYGQVTVYPPAGVKWKKWKRDLKSKFQFLQGQDNSAYDSAYDSDEGSEMSVHAQEGPPTSPTSSSTSMTPATPMTPSSGQRSPRQRSKLNGRNKRRQKAYLPLLGRGRINQIIEQLKRLKNTKRQSNLEFIQQKTTSNNFAKIVEALQPSSTSAAATTNQQDTGKKQTSPKNSAFMNYYKKEMTIKQLRNKRRRNEAATKIQSRIRGRQARKQARTKKLGKVVGVAHTAVKWKTKSQSASKQQAIASTQP